MNGACTVVLAHHMADMGSRVSATYGASVIQRGPMRGRRCAPRCMARTTAPLWLMEGTGTTVSAPTSAATSCRRGACTSCQIWQTDAAARLASCLVFSFTWDILSGLGRQKGSLQDSYTPSRPLASSPAVELMAPTYLYIMKWHFRPLLYSQYPSNIQQCTCSMHMEGREQTGLV